MRVMVEDQFCRPLGCLRVSSFCCETRNRKSDLSMMEVLVLVFWFGYDGFDLLLRIGRIRGDLNVCGCV